MTDDSKESGQQNKDSGLASGRRVYRSPVLQRFGRLSRLTQGSGGNGNDGGGVMNKMSDPALKHNVVCIGTLPSGIGLYLFDYLSSFAPMAGNGRQLGVMADEVEKIMPAAILFDSAGYKMVNYELLGIEPLDVISAFTH
jgi:hypothetical protein